MKEETIKRINGIGKVGNIIARILRILLIIAFILIIGALVVVNVMPKNLVVVDIGNRVGVSVDFSDFAKLSEEEQAEVRKGIEENLKDESLGEYEVTETTIVFHFENHQGTYGIADINGPLVIALIYVIACYVILWFVGLLGKAFRDCDSPFDDNVIKRMKNFAYSLIGWIVVAFVSNIIISRVFLSGFSIQIGFNLGTVLLALVILGLCSIFRYGAKLQKEHDETL